MLTGIKAVGEEQIAGSRFFAYPAALATICAASSRKGTLLR
jgi:hypothetical protein